MSHRHRQLILILRCLTIHATRRLCSWPMPLLRLHRSAVWFYTARSNSDRLSIISIVAMPYIETHSHVLRFASATWPSPNNNNNDDDDNTNTNTTTIMRFSSAAALLALTCAANASTQSRLVAAEEEILISKGAANALAKSPKSRLNPVSVSASSHLVTRQVTGHRLISWLMIGRHPQLLEKSCFGH